MERAESFDSDIGELISYAHGGPALSRKTADRIASELMLILVDMKELEEAIGLGHDEEG